MSEVSSCQTELRIRAAPSILIKEGAPSGTDNWDEYFDDEDAQAETYLRAVWGEDQNWAPGDTDCGWCRHCVDGVDY
jgi:hypothetical protein